MTRAELLVLGVTGQIGKLLAEELKNNENVSLRVTCRRKEQLAELEKAYEKAVYLDLDDPRTFVAALQGVERLFLLTGYTVNMLVQSKAMVDAAKKAGVKHIVHLGVFTPECDCYDPHFAWHQLVEAYIKESGMAYIGEARDDLPELIGRRGLSVREWAELHKNELLALA